MIRDYETRSSMTIGQQLREALVPVIAYHVAVLFSVIVFGLTILVVEGPDPGGVIAMLMMVGITVAGVLTGQVFALLRVRTWVILSVGGVLWTIALILGSLSAVATGGAAAIFALVLILFPIAMSGGLWSLETHRALWATWLPLVFAVGTVLMWAENSGAAEQWFAGNKFAIWDLASLAALAGTLTTLLFFLVSRETHRLALWRRGPMAPLSPSIIEKGASRPRLTFLGVMLVGGFAFALTAGTAILSPYLWRSGPDDDGEPTEQPADPSPADPLPETDGETMKKIVEAAKQTASALCMFTTLGLLIVLGLLIAWRPIKRLLLLRHLREPYWEKSPTARIEQGWRLVEIALGDVGIHPLPGEDAAGLARRAAPMLAKLSPVEVHGLEDAAAVADRVRFGLGVLPGDQEVMERFAVWAMDTIWERLSDLQQVRCMYRGL